MTDKGGNPRVPRSAIAFLVPDMPAAAAIHPYLEQVDTTRWYSNFGPLYQAFEDRLWQVFLQPEGVVRARAFVCANGTAALELALGHLALPVGSRVLVPSFTFPASALAISRLGLQPIFSDVDAHTWQLTPELAEHICERYDVAAVMPVAALGMPVDTGGWDGFVSKTGVPVVIDAAPALGLQRPAKHCYTCFSLHATKFLGVGEGGVVVLPDGQHVDSLRLWSNFGFRDGVVCVNGGNAKLSEYHAAVGLAQMDHLELLVERRNRLQSRYSLRFADKPLNLQVQTCGHSKVDSPVGLQVGVFWACAGVSVPPHCRDVVIRQFAAADIGYRLWYGPALHKHPFFKSAQVAYTEKGRLETTEHLDNTMVGLPFHHFLQDEDIDYIVRALMNAIDSNTH